MFNFDRMHDGFWGGTMFLTGILWLILLALLIAVFVLLFSRLFSGSRDSGSGRKADSSLDILKERYARGEITEEEYDHRKKKLKEDK